MKRIAFLLLASCATSPPDGSPSDEAGPSSMDTSGSDSALPVDTSAHDVDVEAWTGFHEVQVEVDGVEDDLWMYVSAPPGWQPQDGLVAYAHGQGATNILACGDTSDPPDHIDAVDAQRVVHLLNAEGYAAVATFYRNFGPNAGPPALKVRDTGPRDGAALLAAAQWVRDASGTTDPLPTALIGTSMGTTAVHYAGSDAPALAPYQDGLDLRTSVLAAFTLNLLANVSDSVVPFLGATDLEVQANAVGSFALLSAIQIGRERGTIDAGAFEPPLPVTDAVLTPEGRRLVEELFATPPSELGLPECTGIAPAACGGCGEAVFVRAWTEDAPDQVLAGQIDDVTVWFTEDAVDAWFHWAVYERAPTPAELAANPALAELMAATPLYADLNMVTDTVHVLLSEHDHVTQAHGPASRGALLDMLRAKGVLAEPVPTIDEDAQGLCGHNDYLSPDRPDCGYGFVLDALAAAF